MAGSNTPDDADGATTDSTTRRRFVRAAATGAGAFALSGLAAADHGSRNEQGERNGKDGDAHENGTGNGRGRERGRSDDDENHPGNSGEHRRDDEHRPEDGNDDGDEEDDNDNDDGEGGGDDDEDGGDGGDDGDVQVVARRDDDGSVFFLPSGPGTDTNQVDIVVEQASQPVYIRDQFPSDWTVVTGDPHTTYTEGNTRFVEFTDRVEGGDTRTYFADVPDNTGADEFGPIEYSVDGETWTEVPGTTEINTVVAAGTSV